MRRHVRRAAIVFTIVIGLGPGMSRSAAHKPITSPFTFNEDVLPIVQERCGSCHYQGGPAPMSLMTHGDAVPWGESIRAELMAGHMPPWQVDTPAARFRNVQGMSGRELNVLLTWASGGTPPGDPEKARPPIAADRGWPLGTPDLLLPLPEAAIAANVQEQAAEFMVRTPLDAGRFIRAVDLRPGTPAVVRSATVSVVTASAASGGGPVPERLIALWLPGDLPVPLDEGAGYELPSGSELVVRIRYRKTWEYENRPMSDRSTLGLYFAAAPAAAVHALELAGEMTPARAAVFTTILAGPAHAVAIYPDPEFAKTAVTVTAIRPDRSREQLIAFRPQAGWARRYWFREPLSLARGTRIEVAASPQEALLPPGTPAAPPDATPAKVRLVLNVLPSSTP